MQFLSLENDSFPHSVPLLFGRGQHPRDRDLQRRDVRLLHSVKGQRHHRKVKEIGDLSTETMCCIVPSSIVPASGSPLIGFGQVPLDPPVSLMDFHGTLDGTIPYSADSIGANGIGPWDSVVSWDHYYYEQKPATVEKWAGEMGCVGQVTV